MTSLAKGATTPGRGAVQVFIGRGLFTVSGFIISVILARGLGPVEFGVYGVVISVVVWLERVLCAGVPGATATLIPLHPRNSADVEQAARVLLIVWSLPLFGLLWISAPTLANYFDIDGATRAMRIAAIDIPAMSLFFAYEGIFNGRRLFGMQGMMQAIQSITKLLGIVLLLAVGMSVNNAFIVHVGATIATALYLLWAYPATLTLPPRPIMRSMLRIAAPMGLYLMALAVLLNLSLWQLTAEAGDSEGVGFFVAGLNVTRVFFLVPVAITGVLHASLSWALASSQQDVATKYVREAGRFALIITLPACVFLFMDAGAVMGLLFGKGYLAGGRIFAILCVAFGFWTFMDIYFYALMADRQVVLSASIAGLLIPLLFLTDSMMISKDSAIGAAIAMTLVCGVGACAAAALAYRRFGALFEWKSLSRIALATLVAGLLSSLVHVSGFALVIKLGVLWLVYVAMLWLTRELSIHNLNAIMVWKKEH